MPTPRRDLKEKLFHITHRVLRQTGLRSGTNSTSSISGASGENVEDTSKAPPPRTEPPSSLSAISQLPAPRIPNSNPDSAPDSAYRLVSSQAPLTRIHRLFAEHGPIITNTLKLGLEVTESLAEIVPIPGVKAGVGALNTILKRVEQTSQNRIGIESLIVYVELMTDILRKAREQESPMGNQMSQELKTEIVGVESSLRNILEAARRLQDGGKVANFVNALENAQALIIKFQNLEHVLRKFEMSAILKTHLDVVDLKAMAILDKLPRAKGARRDSIDRPACLPGTRTEVLGGITKWINADTQRQIYWLNGGAGTGKTTVALSLANMLAGDNKMTSASFFCSHTTSERSQMNLIFPSLAYQIAQHNKRFRNELIRVIQIDNDIGHASRYTQYERLIIEPLAKIPPPERPIVLVIDALDECSESRAPEEILTIIASGISSIPFLKVFVSSRPTSSTNDAFTNKELQGKGNIFVLHDIPAEFVNEDIRKYVTDRLGRCSRSFASPPLGTWPPKESVEVLVRRAAGLFIYASTACAYVEGRGDPQIKLTFLLNHTDTSLEGIDALYCHILKNAILHFDKQSLVDCRMILAATLHLHNPWRLQDLADLLGCTVHHIAGILGDLQAVIVVPDDPSLPLRTLHASFYDYLTSGIRCLPDMFTPPPAAHDMLTVRLIEYISLGLVSGSANILHPPVAAPKPTYSWTLRYACLHWLRHFQQSSKQPSFGAPLEAFAQQTALHWFHYIAKYHSHDVENQLTQLKQVLSCYECSSLSEFVESCTTYHNDNSISYLDDEFGPLSLLVFQPPEQKMRQFYPTFPLLTAYSPSTIKLETTAFTLCSDGKHFLSGDADGSLRFWEVSESSVPQNNVWRAHNSAILALACRKDNLVASLSSDGDIKLWAQYTGALLAAHRTLLDVRHGNASLAFSQDGRFLVFACNVGWCIWTCTSSALVIVEGGDFSQVTVRGRPVERTKWTLRVYPLLLFSPDNEKAAYLRQHFDPNSDWPKLQETVVLSLGGNQSQTPRFSEKMDTPQIGIIQPSKFHDPAEFDHEDSEEIDEEWHGAQLDSDWRVGFMQPTSHVEKTNRSLEIIDDWICDRKPTRLCSIPYRYQHLTIMAPDRDFILTYLEDQRRFLVIRLHEDYCP